MMNADNLIYAAENLDTINMDGKIYFKDGNGDLHIIDHLYKDVDGDLIMCHYYDKDK